jgi:hypothetical protein
MHEVEAEVQVILGTTPGARLPKPGTRLRSLMSSNKCFYFHHPVVRLMCIDLQNSEYAEINFQWMPETFECNIEVVHVC